MKRPHVTLRHSIAAAGCLIALVALAWLFYGQTTEPIDSYERCVADGNPVLDSYPPVCQAAGRQFIGATVRPAPTPPPAISQPFELLVHGDSHGKYPERQEVIDSQAGWELYWRTVHAGLPTPPPLISVDFRTAAVVALSYGQKPTGGYDEKVTGVTMSSAGTVVDVTQTIPGEGCVVTASVTNPYTMVRTPRLTSPVTFRTTIQKHPC